MKTFLLVFLFLSNLGSNDKLIGLWKSIGNSEIKFINFNSKGDLIEIKESKTKKKGYTLNENFINIKLDNGSFEEHSFYFKGDTLIIQKLKNGKIINDKFIKEEIALYMPKKKKESKGQLAQIVRRKNSTKVKPSGKIYKRNKKIEDD